MRLVGYRPGYMMIGLLLLSLASAPARLGQEFFPTPPSDQAAVYILDDHQNLLPLPFEAARTPIDLHKTAKSTKTSFVEVKGEHASVTLGPNPRLFLFASRAQGAHPAFLVWLNAGHGVRRATAISQAGLAGLAISSDEIVKPTIRVIANVGDQAFMELRPRNSLVPGEYAIIGDDLTRIATFRVALETMR